MKRAGVAVMIAFASIICFSACSGAPPVTEDSPRIVRYEALSGSSGSENSQYVTVSIWFDKAVGVDSRAMRELRLTVNGKAPDAKLMSVTAEAMPGDETGLLITVKAAETAQSPDRGAFFALYEGEIEITAPAGGLRYVTGADGMESVRWETIRCIAPSGMALAEIDSRVGSLTAPARLTVRVDTVPAVRVITWLQLRVNGSPAMDSGFTKGNYSYMNGGSIPVHIHYFLRATPESCAESITEHLNYYFGETGGFTFTPDGSLVIIESTQPVEDESLSLRVWTEYN